MTVSVKNFQIYDITANGEIAPVSLKEASALALKYNSQNEDKIKVHLKPAIPRYEFRNNAQEISILIQGSELPRGACAALHKSGYIIYQHNLIMVTKAIQDQIGQILYGDQKEAISTIKNLDASQINETQKVEIIEKINNQIDNDNSNPNVALAIDLYPYQLTGVDWLYSMNLQASGALLADDMGLGKTAQVIGYITKEISAGRLRQTLIVVPNSLMANWVREIEKFTTGLAAYVHWGPERVGFKQQLENEKIIITTYSTIVNDLSLFSDFKFDLLVCDEASLLKNHNAARTQAINTLNFSFSILITGTPFENSMSDLWSLTNIVQKNYLGQEADFFKKYVNIPLNELQPKQIECVESKVAEIMLRRMKEEVLDDLPEKIDIHTALTPDIEEIAEYEAIVSKIRSSSRDTALALISQLRKYTAHPVLYENRILEASFDELTKKSSKFSYAASLIEEILRSGEKTLVFANHVDLLTSMQNEFSKYFGVPCFKIDGTIQIDERQRIIDRFQTVKSASVLFLNPITAGMGLNITAANHVIHYSRQWNPALEAQATARAFRNGQDKSVNAYYLYYADTIEEVIHNRLHLKTDISNSLVRATTEEFDDEWYLKALGGNKWT